jgi:hypothetical protein
MNLIKKVLKDTGIAISRELKNGYLDWFNESVFRYYFIKNLSQQYPKSRLEIEWKRFDLLMSHGKTGIIIEFKFYFLNKHRDINGEFKRYKGGSGKKNKNEFFSCLDRLSSLTEEGIRGKYLILVYEVAESSKAFGRTYDFIKPELKRFNAFLIRSFDNFIVSKKEKRIIRAKVIKVR